MKFVVMICFMLDGKLGCDVSTIPVDLSTCQETIKDQQTENTKYRYFCVVKNEKNS